MIIGIQANLKDSNNLHVRAQPLEHASIGVRCAGLFGRRLAFRLPQRRSRSIALTPTTNTTRALVGFVASSVADAGLA